MKKFWLLLVLAVVIGVGYYLILLPYEFKVTLQAKTLPGDVIQTVRIWDRSLKNSEIEHVDSLRGLTQRIAVGDRSYIYEWAFSVKNDSVTTIQVRISEPGRRFFNKILVPFSSPPIEQDASETMRTFHEVLMTHLRITRVRVVGESVLDSSFCICAALETRQIEKANGMMKEFPALTDFISVMGLTPKGLPSVRVNDWSHNDGSLKFDFCFPIVETDSLPVIKNFHYKSFNAGRALKAEYYGNYITSDRAWYELMHHARQNDLQVKGFPVEFFHNNPNLGANESTWKAEIFLPLE